MVAEYLRKMKKKLLLLIGIFVSLFLYSSSAFSWNEYVLEQISDRDVWYISTSRDKKQSFGWTHIIVGNCLYKNKKAKKIVNVIHSKIPLPWPLRTRSFLIRKEVYITPTGVRLYVITRTRLDKKNWEENWRIERGEENYFTCLKTDSKGKKTSSQLNESAFDRFQIENICQNIQEFQPGWKKEIKIYNPLRDTVKTILNLFVTIKKVKINGEEIEVTVLRSKTEEGGGDIWLDKKGITVYSEVKGSKFGISFEAVTRLSSKTEAKNLFPESVSPEQNFMD